MIGAVAWTDPLERVLAPSAEILDALRRIPQIVRNTGAIADATEALPKMERQLRAVVRHTESLPALAEQMAVVGDATAVLRPMDARMASIEGAMPVLVEVQQHLARVPDTLEHLDAGLTRMSDTLERLLVALERLDAELASLDSAVGPLGRLAQRFPGRWPWCTATVPRRPPTTEPPGACRTCGSRCAQTSGPCSSGCRWRTSWRGPCRPACATLPPSRTPGPGTEDAPHAAGLRDRPQQPVRADVHDLPLPQLELLALLARELGVDRETVARHEL